jgi:hypothetical protein
VYLPVIRQARDGAQTGIAVYQRSKTVPSEARRSRFGVVHSFRPLKPVSVIAEVVGEDQQDVGARLLCRGEAAGEAGGGESEDLAAGRLQYGILV